VETSPWSLEPSWEGPLLVAIATALYAVLVLRHGASRRRIAAFAVAQVLLLAVLVSPVATIALHYLLSAHLLQNVAAAEWAPALAVLGIPPAAAAALGRMRVFCAVTRPFVALPLWLAAYGLWHVPLFYEAALRNEGLLFLEHGSYVAAGVLLWWPVLQDEPHRLSAGARSAYLFAAFVLASPLGLMLALLPTPLYGFYEAAPRLWGLSPLTDQQLAGVVMAVSEAVVFFAAFAVYFVRFMAEEEAGYSPRDARR
jgi:cytochrome c oxidase assembly factor CtaG